MDCFTTVRIGAPLARNIQICEPRVMGRCTRRCRVRSTAPPHGGHLLYHANHRSRTSPEVRSGDHRDRSGRVVLPATPSALRLTTGHPRSKH